MASTKKTTTSRRARTPLMGADMLIAEDVYDREDKGLGDVEEME
jgi:hypothetical protein